MKKLIVTVLTAFFTQTATAGEQLKMIGDMTWVLSSGVLTGIVAKEFCSCRYVVGLSLEECRQRTPLLPAKAFDALIINEYRQERTIQVAPKIFLAVGPRAEATFNAANPRLGCVMTYGAIEFNEEFDRQALRNRMNR